MFQGKERQSHYKRKRMFYVIWIKLTGGKVDGMTSTAFWNKSTTNFLTIKIIMIPLRFSVPSKLYFLEQKSDTFRFIRIDARKQINSYEYKEFDSSLHLLSIHQNHLKTIIKSNSNFHFLKQVKAYLERFSMCF